MHSSFSQKPPTVQGFPKLPALQSQYILFSVGKMCKIYILLCKTMHIACKIKYSLKLKTKQFQLRGYFDSVVLDYPQKYKIKIDPIILPRSRYHFISRIFFPFFISFPDFSNVLKSFNSRVENKINVVKPK